MDGGAKEVIRSIKDKIDNLTSEESTTEGHSRRLKGERGTMMRAVDTGTWWVL